jgi:hypothetical protein
MIQTPEEGRRFFVDKIVTEAGWQEVVLSANERKMLDWSEVEPGCVNDPEVAEALKGEISDEAYEEKMGQLLEASFRRDIAADPRAREAYRSAYKALKQGDYYL